MDLKTGVTTIRIMDTSKMGQAVVMYCQRKKSLAFGNILRHDRGGGVSAGSAPAKGRTHDDDVIRVAGSRQPDGVKLVGGQAVKNMSPGAESDGG